VFPYTPKTEYVFEPTDEFPNEVTIDEQRTSRTSPST